MESRPCKQPYIPEWHGCCREPHGHREKEEPHTERRPVLNAGHRTVALRSKTRGEGNVSIEAWSEFGVHTTAVRTKDMNMLLHRSIGRVIFRRWRGILRREGLAVNTRKKAFSLKHTWFR